MAMVIVRYPDGREDQRRLEGELTVGRADGNGLVLTEGGVSRRHARLFLGDEGEVLVEDTGSANGTFVDGERITGPTPLPPGAVVGVGDYELRLSASAPSRSKAPLAVRGAGRPRAEVPARGGRPTAMLSSVQRGERVRAERVAPPPVNGPCLRGLTGSWANQVFPLRGAVVVGRTAGAQVVLEDDSVSRRHAEVRRSSDGYVVRDLGSANGTLVNGEPAGTDELILKPGDILQFGAVELQFEEGEVQEVLNAPVRRRRGQGAVAPAGEPLSGARKGLIAGGMGVGALVLVVALAKLLAPAPVESPQSASLGAASEAAASSRARLDELLTQCRSYSVSEEWVKALAACDEALNLEPIHVEANELLARVLRDKDAHALFTRAEKAISRGADEEALSLLERIPRESPYYLKAKPQALVAARGLKRSAGDDCRRYAARGFWKEALGRCELYMRIACQDMDKEELSPPPGVTVSLSGRLRKDEWRPKDARYRNLLLARERVQPSSAPWECPEVEILRQGREQSNEKAELTRVLSERFPEKVLVTALLDYQAGRGNEAIVRLQKLRADPDKAHHHAITDDLLKHVSLVHQLFNLGQSHLKADAPERAAEPFREALDYDRRLMKDLAEAWPSWYARGIRSDLSSAAYRRGKMLADVRQNFREACRVWKAGFEFNPTNMDLGKAMNFCSGRAKDALASADSCAGLELVLDFAVPPLGEGVPGDGFAELAKEKQAELGCR